MAQEPLEKQIPQGNIIAEGTTGWQGDKSLRKGIWEPMILENGDEEEEEFLPDPWVSGLKYLVDLRVLRGKLGEVGRVEGD